MVSDSAAAFLIDHGTTLVSVGGSIIAGSIAFAKYLEELRKARAQQLEMLKQKANELRWEQAKVGKTLNDEMLEDVEACGAMQMLDMEPEGSSVRLPNERSFVATYDDVVRAITWRVGQDRDPTARDRTHLEYSPKWVEIRTCFDSFFYYLAIIEHYLTSGLLHFDDVAYPLTYYVRLLAHNRWRTQFRAYIDYYRLGRARKFLQRFESWRVLDENDQGRADDAELAVPRQ